VSSRIPDYDALARREGEHWGRKTREEGNPQSWEDPFVHELFFGAAEREFLAAVAAAGPRALELGCGFGEHAGVLAARGLAVTAIDLSEERVRVAREHTPGVTFLAGNLDTMRLPDGPFDVVYAHDALHHCVDLEHVLAEAERVLRPGGALVVSDYRGSWRALRLLAAGLVFVLPTTMPYAHKWARRARAGPWLASERAKRAALARGDGAALHDASPFEGVSQESIVPAIARRFEVRRLRTRLPFWWYVAPKLRLGPARRTLLAAMRRGDDALQALGAPGAFFTLEARRRGA
jgi:2-polyprenyl-3-methyl-5-hydroxy-6-metoxy-1,4-benzoquinol methylase